MFRLILLVSLHFVLSSSEPFYWGVATAAYQIEGGTNIDGRGDSIWDTFSKRNGTIRNNNNAENAAKSYYFYKKDVELIKAMNDQTNESDVLSNKQVIQSTILDKVSSKGVNAYRFSLSWSRILPNGRGEINPLGINYYNNLINEVISMGLEPFVTIYHWDLPQALEDEYGGWLDERIIDDFVYFANICFNSFGDRVKKWITVNEPWTFSLFGYETGTFAPGNCGNRQKCVKGDSSVDAYRVAHHVLLSHAAVVHHYRTVYQSNQGGIIGITLNLDWNEPLDKDCVQDVEAAERRNEFILSWFTDPLVLGHYPHSMVQYVGDRLPVFTESQRKLVKGSFDFIGLNHYTSSYVTSSEGLCGTNPSELAIEKLVLNNILIPTNTSHNLLGWLYDQKTISIKYNLEGNLIGLQGESNWLHIVPWGFKKMILWFHHRYLKLIENESVQSVRTAQAIPIYITENGFDVLNESNLLFPEVLHDTMRISYYEQYLKALDEAIEEGADVRGYFAWSLMDNFEWVDGYNKRFGLHYVDYNHPNRTRYAKDSSVWYANYAKQHYNNVVKIDGDKSDGIQRDSVKSNGVKHDGIEVLQQPTWETSESFESFSAELLGSIRKFSMMEYINKLLGSAMYLEIFNQRV